MITKKEFFAILKDENNKIGVTAHIAVCEHDGFMPMLIIEQHKAPNAFLSSHRSRTVLHATFAKYNAWLNEWLAERAAAAEVRMVEEDRAETLVVDDAEMSRRCRDAVFFGSLDSFGRRVIVEAAHGEALALNVELDEVAAANQWDDWANQHDSRKTEAQMIESDHAEALEFDREPKYFVMAKVKRGPLSGRWFIDFETKIKSEAEDFIACNIEKHEYRIAKIIE